MKKRSIRRRLLIRVGIFVVLAMILMILISRHFVHIICEDNAEWEMQLIDRINLKAVGEPLQRIEVLTTGVASFASMHAGSDAEALLSDSDKRREYLADVDEVLRSEIAGAGTVSSAFFLFDKKVGSEAAGVTYTLDANNENPTRQDILSSPYYEKAPFVKEAVWVGPYEVQDDIYDSRVMSYIVPVYANSVYIGIMGIDIDVSFLCDELGSTHFYADGVGALYSADGNLIYTKNDPDGIAASDYTDSQRMLYEKALESAASGEVVEYMSDIGFIKLYGEKLRNGMVVSLYVPATEIFDLHDQIVTILVICGVTILALALALILYEINRFLRPLSELTAASEKIADGDMDVRIEYDGDDEMGQLGRTFRMMADSIQKYFNHFHSLAYTDVLTGLNNKAAYEITRDVIESEVRMGKASFSIIVMDVNNLKVINDSIGHEKGDIMLTHVAECLRKAFVGYPLYRIGGDEFCSIVNNIDPQILIDLLQATTAKRSDEDYPYFHCRYQIAAGYATYDKGSDSSFHEVFQRADDAMYENKRALKEKEKQRASEA